MVEKILVQILELNNRTKWKKCPINSAGCIMIHKGGKGPKDINEYPRLEPEHIFKKGFRKLETDYVIYPRGSNKLLKREDSKLDAINPAMIQKWINNEAFSSHFGESKTSLIQYITLLGIALMLMEALSKYVR